MPGYESEAEDEVAAKELEPAEAESKEDPNKQKTRKKLEPYEVPTSGDFWMHDDRIDDDEGAMQRCAPNAAHATVMIGTHQGVTPMGALPCHLYQQGVGNSPSQTQFTQAQGQHCMPRSAFTSRA